MTTEKTKINDMQLISATDVARLCTLSRSNLFEQEAAGTFPARVVLSERRFAYPAKEVDAWFAAKFALREKWFPEYACDFSNELDTMFAHAADPEAAAAEYAAEMDAKIEKLEANESTKGGMQ